VSEGRPEDPVVHVVCGFDENYAMPAGVMIRSVARTLRPGLRAVAHLVGIGLSPESKDKLRACGSDNLDVQFREFDMAWVSAFPNTMESTPHLNATVYISVMTDRFLPPDVKRFVMLDADMIVLSSIDEIVDADLGDNIIGGVQDYGVCVVGHPYGIKHWRSLGLDNRAPYFNGGMLVVDRDAWRAAQIEQGTIEYLETYAADINFLEQEALNATIAGRWHRFPLRWDYMAYLERVIAERDDRIYEHAPGAEVDEARANPALVHYADSPKPWQWGCTLPFNDKWWEVVRETPWASFQPASPVAKRSFVAEAKRRGKWAASVLIRG
jgi:lipopolysaccharide biosynthesis glycosyltransferase